MEETINIENMPEHVAIIMDGNRRWARREGLDVPSGHREGAENLRRIARYANKIGIKHLTVFAFSTENWNRSEVEIKALMFLFRKFLDDAIADIDNNNIKINIIGSKNRLANDILDKIEKLTEKTKNNTGMVLNVALNYGGRYDITSAVKKIAQKAVDNEISIDEIDEKLISDNLLTAGQPDPDLLIRTSGEERISNFLIWQIAYSELYFTDKYWPEFSDNDLIEALQEYQHRNRRFGGK